MKKLCNFPIINLDNFKYNLKKLFSFQLSLKVVIKMYYNKNFLYKHIKKETYKLKKLYALHQTKTRKHIISSTRKIRKQKGTGKARVRNLASPLYKGGGVIFGPQKKLMSYKLNKKEKQLILHYLLYKKKNNLLFIYPNILVKANLTLFNLFYVKVKQFGLGVYSKILLVVPTTKLKIILFNALQPLYLNIILIRNLNSIDLLINDYIIFFI